MIVLTQKIERILRNANIPTNFGIVQVANITDPVEIPEVLAKYGNGVFFVSLESASSYQEVSTAISVLVENYLPPNFKMVAYVPNLSREYDGKEINARAFICTSIEKTINAYSSELGAIGIDVDKSTKDTPIVTDDDRKETKESAQPDVAQTKKAQEEVETEQEVTSAPPSTTEEYIPFGTKIQPNVYAIRVIPNIKWVSDEISKRLQKKGIHTAQVATDGYTALLKNDDEVRVQLVDGRITKIRPHVQIVFLDSKLEKSFTPPVRNDLVVVYYNADPKKAKSVSKTYFGGVIYTSLNPNAKFGGRWLSKTIDEIVKIIRDRIIVSQIGIG